MAAPNASSNVSSMASLVGIYNTAKEKWDASGGNEALGRVTASIPESTKTMLGSMFKKENLRGPSVFFGIGEERPYYIEKTPSLLAERLRHNFTFFYLNYLLIAGVLFCLTLLVNISTIIGLAILGGAWFWLIRASQDGTLRISSLAIPQKTAVIVMGGITVVVLIYLLKGIFWWALFSSGILVSVHAFLRDASMHKDMDDVMKMEGDFSINEESSFLDNTARVSRNAPDANELVKAGESNIADGDDMEGAAKRPSYRGGPIRSENGWVVFVTDLHEETREDDVTDAFTDAIGGGPITFVRVNFDRKTGKCKGYAVVEYGQQTEAQDAINKLHGTDLLGKTIGVHWAFVKPSDSSPQST